MSSSTCPTMAPIPEREWCSNANKALLPNNAGISNSAAWPLVRRVRTGFFYLLHLNTCLFRLSNAVSSSAGNGRLK